MKETINVTFGCRVKGVVTSLTWSGDLGIHEAVGDGAGES